jgi:hypothetical protein
VASAGSKPEFGCWTVLCEPLAVGAGHHLVLIPVQDEDGHSDVRRGEPPFLSAGDGSKGQRWYAWAWIATTSPPHHLLVRRHLRTGDLAFHYCWVPGGQLLTKARLIRAAGLRWPVEEDFAFSKDRFGLGQCQAWL